MSAHDFFQAFPYLWHFLTSEFIQDHEDDRSLERIAAEFTSRNNPFDVAGTRADIERFLRLHPQDPDGDFLRLFPSTVDPRAFGLGTAAWLRTLAGLLEPPAGR